MPLFDKSFSFVTVLLLVIGDIKYLTRNDTYLTMVTTMKLSNYP